MRLIGNRLRLRVLLDKSLYFRFHEFGNPGFSDHCSILIDPRDELLLLH